MESNLIGDKIARARKKVFLSQAQLAEQLFISPQAVGKWERGESIPDIVTMTKLAKILEVDLNYFSDNLHTNENDKISQGAGADVIEQLEKAGDNEKIAGERPLLTSFNGGALTGADFAGVSAQNRKFIGSDLRGTDFSGADLSGSVFVGCDLRETNFSLANLTDCVFTALDLAGATFCETILVRSAFNSTSLEGAKFTNSKLVDVKLTATDLSKAVFENCHFIGVDFKSSDLSGQRFDGQRFTGVRFDNAGLKGASFKKASLKNVSFRPTFALTNRYYKSLATINFEGAVMDKLTYAALKGVGVELPDVKFPEA